MNRTYRYRDIERHTGLKRVDIYRLVNKSLIAVDRFGPGNHRTYSREDMELCKVVALLRSGQGISGKTYYDRVHILTVARSALNDPQRSGDFLQIWRDTSSSTESDGWVGHVTDKPHLDRMSIVMRVAELTPPAASLSLGL